MANNDEHGFGSMNEDKQRDIASAIANVTPASVLAEQPRKMAAPGTSKN